MSVPPPLEWFETRLHIGEYFANEWLSTPNPDLQGEQTPWDFFIKNSHTPNDYAGLVRYFDAVKKNLVVAKRGPMATAQTEAKPCR